MNDATFAGTGAVLQEPTFINFLFGNNGAGKSTISRSIGSGVGVTYAPGRSAEDYLVLLYDEDFIDRNFHSYHSMDGVFTINAVNLEVQRQLEEKERAQSAARDQRVAAAGEKEKKVAARLSLVKKFQQNCWDAAKDRRIEFDKTQDLKRKTKQFTDAVLAAAPEEKGIEALRALYAQDHATKPIGRIQLIREGRDNITGARRMKRLDLARSAVKAKVLSLQTPDELDQLFLDDQYVD